MTKLEMIHLEDTDNFRDAANLTTDVAIKFLDFEKSLKKENRGGVIMYDLKGHYKYITTQELFNEFINNHYPFDK